MPGRKVSLVWQHDPAACAPARYRRACRYDAFVPDPLAALEVRLDARVAGILSEAEDAIRSLNSDEHGALGALARLLLRTESIASSKVAGTQLGIRELAHAEARAEAGGNPGATAAEILANIDAMEVALHEAASVDAIGLEEIKKIHCRLMENAPGAHLAGRIRDRQSWIGGNDYNPCGAEFVPPPPREIDRLLVDLCDSINDGRPPPMLQAALIYAQFETIRPFYAGNGRTGRALIHVVLRRRGIAASYVPPVSVVLADDPNRYIEGLTHFRDGDVPVWLEHFAAAAARAARLARAYLSAVDKLIERWRARLAAGAAPRADAAAWAIIDVLPAHPIIAAPVAAAATHRAKAAIYQGLAELELVGILAPVSQSRRNRSWEAAGLLELLAGLEAGRFPTLADALEQAV